MLSTASPPSGPDRLRAPAGRGFFPRRGGSALDDLLDGVSSLVRFYADNRAFLRIMLLDFSSPEGHPSVTQQIGKPGPFAAGAFSPMYSRLEAILKSLAMSGTAREVPASVLLNVVLGAITLNLIYPPAPPTEDIAGAVDGIVRDLVLRYLQISPDKSSK